MDKTEFRFWRIRYPLENDDTFFVITTKNQGERVALRVFRDRNFSGERIPKKYLVIDEVAVDLSPAAEKL